MFIETTEGSGMFLDTEEAIIMIAGPTNDQMAEMLKTFDPSQFLFGSFGTERGDFILVIRKIRKCTQWSDSWWLVAELPSGRDVLALWSPNSEQIKGYLWLNINPKQLTVRPTITPSPRLSY